jgi:Fe2+ or Zn2+ uptake regulation protein
LRLSLDNGADPDYHDGVLDTPNPIVRALDAAGYRLTEPRLAVAELIVDHDGHFTASELAATASQRRLGVSRATLFRTLDLMVELGAVERLDLPNGEHAYVPCAAAHHHHVVCRRCGRTAEVDDAGLNEAVREIERTSGFRIDTHRLELFGLCRHCQALAGKTVSAQD